MYMRAFACFVGWGHAAICVCVCFVGYIRARVFRRVEHTCAYACFVCICRFEGCICVGFLMVASRYACLW